MRGLNIYTHPHTYCGRRDSKTVCLSQTQVCTHKHINTCILISIATVHSFTHAHKIIAHVYDVMSTSPYLLNAEGMTFETNTNAVCEDCFSCRHHPKAKPRWKLAKIRLLPGRTATFQHLQRCIGVFVYVFSFCAAIFLPFPPTRTSPACWVYG